MRLFVNILAVSGSAMFADVLLAIRVLLGSHWQRLSALDLLDSFTVYAPFMPQAIGVGFPGGSHWRGGLYLVELGPERSARCGC